MIQNANRRRIYALSGVPTHVPAINVARLVATPSEIIVQGHVHSARISELKAASISELLKAAVSESIKANSNSWE